VTATDLCELVVVLDRSGSMQPIAKDMEGGFDQLIADQRKLPGRCLVTLVQFDSERVETVYEAKPVAEVPALSLVPRGSTPLLDAVGSTIKRTGDRLATTPEAARPGKVIMLIVTDGQENASREYKKEQVKAMVEHQRTAYQWEFIYLGANVDAFAEAGSLGINLASASNYIPDSAGAQAVYVAASASVGRSRAGGSTALTDDERRKLNRI
jgi:uncharacterized protein YegL